MRELDHLVIEVANCSEKLNEFIPKYDGFIIKCASSVAKRYIIKSDEEWSIALYAFTEAIKAYDLEKGSFMSFAKLIIHRRIVDYYRSLEKKQNSEVLVDPKVFNSDYDAKVEDIAIGLSVAKQVSKQEEGSLKLEIDAVNELFPKYGFSFMDLTTCSPKAAKTKAACAKAIIFLLEHSMLIHEMRCSKMLPLIIIEKKTKVPRKILERHRKYLIAATEILYGDYPYLSEYLSYVREEENHESSNSRD